jgi:hypothetical protein
MVFFHQQSVEWLRRSGFLLILLLAAAFWSGCSEHVDYRLGIVTSSVSGKLTAGGDLTESRLFIIVRKYNRTLIENADGFLYRVSAEIAYPDNGEYSVKMDWGVDQVELMFLSRNYIPVIHHFKRTLGVGEYIYHVKLQKDATWQNNYYLLIKPVLSEYILEQRFNMRQTDQLFLGQWMDRTEDAIAVKK